MNWRVFGSPMPVMVGRVVPGSLLPRAGAFSQGYVQPLAPVAPVRRERERERTLLADAHVVVELSAHEAPGAVARQDPRQGSGWRGERDRGCSGSPARVPIAGLDVLAHGLPRIVDGPRLWPTPRASAGGPEMKKLRMPGHTGVNLATAVHRLTPGPLNPAWVEWLCGFPQGWTECRP